MEINNSSNNENVETVCIYQDNEIFINDEYALLPDKRLGSGAFGELFYGFIIEGNKEIAIKLEKNSIKHPQLYYEYKIYKALKGGSKSI